MEKPASMVKGSIITANAGVIDPRLFFRNDRSTVKNRENVMATRLYISRVTPAPKLCVDAINK
jgi:hypothetical protein